MPTFVLEIGYEEMPARFLAGMMKYAEDALTKALTESGIAFGALSANATPRRLAVIARDVATEQKSEEQVFTGPPWKAAFDAEGNPGKALLGFARGHGVEPSAVFPHQTPKGEYAAVRKMVGGGRSADLLSGICARLIASIPFPKKMRWEDSDATFGRPARWILALLGDTVIPVTFANIVSGNTTTGHRVMGPGPFVVPDADAYLDILSGAARVVVDPEERRRIIRERGAALAADQGATVIPNDGLLDHVSGLVEWPVPILGAFDPAYLELPREVLLTSMETHQKSFGLQDVEGRLKPLFLTVLNIAPRDEELVRKGWQRVLKARLEDARFFWNTDNASTFDAWLTKLDSVVFIGPIGTMGDKSRRLEKLAAWIAAQVRPELEADMARAGRLAKADLVSEMVGEFDDLQGVMGGIYARRKGESENVARAIGQQYLPAGPDSPVPASLPGAILSIAEKADNLVGCFGLSMIPTGANDPYALRRQVLGICRIVLEHGLRLDLPELFRQAQSLYEQAQWKLRPADAQAKLMEFTAGRLKAFFQAKGFETLAIDAAVAAGCADVRELAARIQALADFSREPDFNQAVLTFKRAGNIIRKQGEEAGVTLTGLYRPALLSEPQENALAVRLAEIGPRFDELWANDDFPGLMAILRELRPFVDDFFDHVMVMCEDPDLRANRLNLLKALIDKLARLADFSALQV